MSYYTPEEQRQNKRKWIARIKDWQNSGLSGAAWCRQENLVYHQFTYWKKKLLDEPDQALSSGSFIELVEGSSASGIEIAVDEVSIHLAKNFDNKTLVRCLRTLKDFKC